jgi:hypothetical protein
VSGEIHDLATRGADDRKVRTPIVGTRHPSNRDDETGKRIEPLRSFPWQLSRRRTVPIVLLVVVVSFAVATVTFRYFNGPAWRIRTLLRAEALALEAGDQSTFMSLQDSADQAWWRYQRSMFNSRMWAEEHGEQWPVDPRPRVIEVRLQGEKAWADVVSETWDTTVRRVEFFRLVDGLWKHTGPDERYWGSPRETQTEHLRWIYRERDEEWVTDLLDEGEQTYQRICGDFGLDPPGQQVTIEVEYSMDAYEMLFYPEGPTLSLPPPLLRGVRDDDEVPMASPLRALLVNYLALQPVGGEVSEVRAGRRAVYDAIISWETDMLLGTQWESSTVSQLTAACEAGKLFSLNELHEVWTDGITGWAYTGEDYRLATAQSRSLIDYIVEKYGRESIAPLLRALGNSLSLEEALQEALGPGFVIEEFELDWLTYVWEEYGPTGMPPAITPSPTRSRTPGLSLPAMSLPLPVVEGTEAYRPSMRPGSEDDVEGMADLPHYDLALQTDLENGILLGRERLVFVNRESEALKDILLRLYPNCSQAGSMTVGRVSSGGKAVDFAYQAEDTAVLVSLPRPLFSGESITIEMDFATRLHPQIEGVWSAAFFYPVLSVYQDGRWRQDAVSSGPDAVFSESASYAVELIVPDTTVVAASGVEVHAVDNGDGTITHSYRGSPLRGFALFVSEDFHPSSATVDGVVVNAWYLPGDEETGEGILQYASDAVGVFDERFGPYPYAELDVVVIPDTRLPADLVTGVEYPTLAAVLHGGAGDPEFATVHEVAHQWWYGVVGNDVLQEPWLDESFANYSTIVCYEDVHGQEEAQRAYQERIGSRYEQIRGSEQDGPVGRSIQDFAEAGQPSGPIIYGKGAVFLDTLRHEVGDEAFFAILREYFQRYKYGRATGDGFLKVAEEVVGAELDPLYDAWIRK